MIFFGGSDTAGYGLGGFGAGQLLGNGKTLSAVGGRFLFGGAPMHGRGPLCRHSLCPRFIMGRSKK